ncbi:MAG TPA: anion permease, partial [Opitutales bacterium]|nr:anion permease [Opitutales bacterium]
PELKTVPAARQIAEKALNDVGPMSRHEWMMVGVFILMLGAWIVGPQFGLDNTSAALLTLCVLLLSGILTWSDILAEREAWQTLIWLGILVGMAKCLDESGV